MSIYDGLGNGGSHALLGNYWSLIDCTEQVTLSPIYHLTDLVDLRARTTRAFWAAELPEVEEPAVILGIPYAGTAF
ncbi:hypothetical protein ALQ37_200188 [Pseudomonas syringae pv. aptata]|uniref:Uncharacterized protein n=1 Tax=Pseudomonas syringae pv. aptata TaxID=83167 RepID=A0A3M3X3V6_PSEAP|nr:hypothetical protein C5I_0114620 [Pseudomonas syringae pv. syringae FF5]RMM21936.1 hypothetical protein ALQ81_200060 [Pseudomonas syringae pv. pisi]RMO50247.1 hypothetical protein ALQ40_200232 [Pseudomonas syringae]RMO64615.1 hypothetical protein ALQ37_200188 [Pseudomonas syringae pv. aptata]BBN63822.1 hypothetical protein KUIN1_30120 [Pseudomonas sp. KUIN-1]